MHGSGVDNIRRAACDFKILVRLAGEKMPAWSIPRNPFRLQKKRLIFSESRAKLITTHGE